MNFISLLWTVFALVWLIGWVRTKQTRQRQPFSRRLMYSIPIVIGSYFLFSDRVALGWVQNRMVPRHTAIETAAILLTAAGIGLAIWARFYLGRNWSSTVTIKVDHTLVRTGPYRFVRHPIYSGLLLAIAGTALARGRPIGILTVALFYLGFSLKLRLEEEFMRNAFGSEYDQYANSTGALIPKL